jgi:hypothetical protein
MTPTGMTPTGLQLYLPLIVTLVIVAIMARRTLRPRRFRVPTLWIGPAFVLAGGVTLLMSSPTPTPGHGAALAALTAAGAGIGWLRAKLVKLDYDLASDSLTMRGTPYGLLLLVGLIAVRQGLRIATITHPEWGVDLNRATDLLAVFAFGLVSGYSAELYRAAIRARKSVPAVP